MIRFPPGFLVLFFPMLCFASPADKDCQNWTKQAIENPSVGCESACSQAQRFDKYDYHSALIASQKSRAGLVTFFRYTGRSTIMGAGAEEQACHLYSLLLQWGDAPFAKSLARAGAKAKTRVIGLLDYTAVTDFKKRFPKTYGLVAKHEE